MKWLLWTDELLCDFRLRQLYEDRFYTKITFIINHINTHNTTNGGGVNNSILWVSHALPFVRICYMQRKIITILWGGSTVLYEFHVQIYTWVLHWQVSSSQSAAEEGRRFGEDDTLSLHHISNSTASINPAPYALSMAKLCESIVHMSIKLWLPVKILMSNCWFITTVF